MTVSALSDSVAAMTTTAADNSAITPAWGVRS